MADEEAASPRAESNLNMTDISPNIPEKTTAKPTRGQIATPLHFIGGSTKPRLSEFTVSTVKGMPPDVEALTVQLFTVWREKYPRNLLRSHYFNAVEELKNLNISVPTKVADRVRSVTGWPAKAVRALADLTRYQGISLDDADTYGLKAIAARNDFETMIPQLVTSAYKHSCAFLTVTKDAQTGRAVIMPRSAQMSAGLWDSEHNRLAGALTITRTDSNGKPDKFVVWLPGQVWECERTGGQWAGVYHEQAYKGVAVSSYAYDPQLDRPFGRSRITRPLMSYTDAANRELLRIEITAEFYSAPRLWFLGIDDDALGGNKWETLITSVNGITKDAEGGVPQMHQVSQMSMQPHSDLLRTLALMVSSETNLPVSDLGITTENPASAEAQMVAERKLTRDADRQNSLLARTLQTTLGIAAAIENDSPTIPADAYNASILFAPTRETSLGARGDFFTKVASVAPAWVKTATAWNMLGLSSEQAEEALRAVKTAETANILDSIAAKVNQQKTEKPEQ